jgi:hypothetical protein
MAGTQRGKALLPISVAALAVRNRPPIIAFADLQSAPLVGADLSRETEIRKQ